MIPVSETLVLNHLHWKIGQESLLLKNQYNYYMKTRGKVKTTKRGKRGPYKKRKTLQKVELVFINTQPLRIRQPGVKVANTCISMDAETATAMGFKPNSYVVIGKSKDGKEIYLTPKPKNVTAGHKLRASKTGRLTASVRTKAYKLSTGIYQPGNGVLANLPTEQGEFVETVAYPLIHK